MIQMYGSPQSSAGRCYWTMEEIGLSYERVPVSFKDREHKSPAFLTLNPNGKVPVLVDGDLVMWESIAIDRYLAERHGASLLGESVIDRAHVDQWSAWSQIELQPPIIAVFIQLVFVAEEDRDADLIAKSRAKTEPLMALLDAHLADDGFMVGDSFSLADLHVASVAKLLPRLGFEMSAAPHLAGWLERMLARPAAQRVAALA